MIETDGLKTLSEDGAVPETRMGDALNVVSRVQTLVNADNDYRAYKRALVKGFVDGNPPYNHGDLVAAGRADMCNVNWRIGEAYLATALSAVYDIFSQSVTYANVETAHGKGQQRADWSAIITEHFDRLQKSDRYFDYEMQNSQFDMTLYGCGPMIFRNSLDWRARFNPCGMLLVPEMAKSKTEEWEEAAYRIYYTTHDLYNYIRYPDAAANAGWDVEQVKCSIIAAHPRTIEGGQYMTWEWHQQQLKNNSYQYSAESKSIHVAHYFFREFPMENEELGMITHTMVDMALENQGASQFLYRCNRRFRSWDQIIHPMYYDHGGGGYHHSVTGMGVKMYAAMTYQNRLLCNLADKCFAPKIMFKPTSASQDEVLNLARFGDYAKIPRGFDMVQTPVQGMLDEGLAFNRSITEIVSSNLAQYRHELQKDSGNPPTASQVNYQATQEATLGETQITHYYNQLDWLYLEKFRRACNFNLPDNVPGAQAAKKFQQDVIKAGVPKEALHRIGEVKASRVVGQGSSYLRKQTLMRLLAQLPRLPESGQERLIRDYIASEAGFSMVNRYVPESGQNKLPGDNEMLAVLQIGNAKQGVQPVVTESQNPVIFAGMFLKAASETMAGIKKAGPQSLEPALVFLESLAPAIARQLDRIKDDPTRAETYKDLKEQFDRMAQLTDELHKRSEMIRKKQQIAMQKRQQAQQRMMQMANGQDPETAIKTMSARTDIALKTAKVQNDIRNKNAKAMQNLQVKAAQVRQNLGAKDVLTAQQVRSKRLTSLAE